MANTSALSILYVVIASCLGAIGQFLIKEGTNRIDGGVSSFLTNWRIISGMACYLVVMVLFVNAFKRGGSVTVLYPIYASTFIWAAIIALIYYNQPIRTVHVLGMALLVLGMFLCFEIFSCM